MAMRIHKINIHPDKGRGKPCTGKTEVYSRVCGFYRPVQQWNKGKRDEYRDRVEFNPEKT